MTAAASPKKSAKKEEKTKEDKINEIMADGATAVKMEVDYRLAPKLNWKFFNT